MALLVDVAGIAGVRATSVNYASLACDGDASSFLNTESLSELNAADRTLAWGEGLGRRAVAPGSRVLAPSNLGSITAQLLVQAPPDNAALSSTTLAAYGTAPPFDPAASSLGNIVSRLAAISTNVAVLNDTITMWSPFVGGASAVVVGVNASSIAPGSPLPVPGSVPSSGARLELLALLLLLLLVVMVGCAVWVWVQAARKRATEKAWLERSKLDEPSAAASPPRTVRSRKSRPRTPAAEASTSLHAPPSTMRAAAFHNELGFGVSDEVDE